MRKISFAFLFSLGFLLQSCGETWEDLTNPTKDTKEEQKKRDQEQKDKLNQLVHNSLYFDLKSEAEACNHAKEVADDFSVTLNSCYLSESQLFVSVSDDDASFEGKLSYSNEDETELRDSAENTADREIRNFLVTMVSSISYSRKHQQ